MKESDIVIIACGYSANSIPIFDHEGNKLKLKRIGD
jgi:hypothetical protein